MLQLEEFSEITRKIRKNRGVIQVTGCIDPQKPHFISCSSQGYSHRVIVTYSDLRAKELYEKEVLTGEEFNRLMQQSTLSPAPETASENP